MKKKNTVMCICMYVYYQRANSVSFLDAVSQELQTKTALLLTSLHYLCERRLQQPTECKLSHHVTCAHARD